MKIELKSVGVAFKPYQLVVTVESQEEDRALQRLGGYYNSVPNLIYDGNSNTLHHPPKHPEAIALSKFITGIREALGGVRILKVQEDR